MRKLIFVVALAVVCPLSAADWKKDLDFLTAEIERVHPNPYRKVTRAEFHSAVADLARRAPDLQPYAVVAELSRIMATLRDGHTRLTIPVDPNAGFFLGHTPTPEPKEPALRLRHLPVRFYWYDDGLFVRDAADERLIGAKITGIGATDVAVALEKMSRYVSADNEWQKRLLVADYLVLPEFLAASGIATSPEAVELRTDKATVTLDAIPYGTPAPWLDKQDQRKFWFRYLPSERIVYFAYNEVGNEEKETLADFAKGLFGFIEANPVEALIIDIRQNPGGNGSLNRYLIHELIRSRKLQEPGRVFVLAGRRTFSAALFFALDLEQQTNALFVGEPIGAKPNHFGDSRRLLLPSSGLTVRSSTLYWQKSDPRDGRDSIPPHIAVPLTSESLRRDVALDTIVTIVKAMRTKGTLDDRWSGTASLFAARYPITPCSAGVSPAFGGNTRECLPFTGRVGDGWAFGTFTSSGHTIPFYLKR